MQNLKGRNENNVKFKADLNINTQKNARQNLKDSYALNENNDA